MGKAKGQCYLHASVNPSNHPHGASLHSQGRMKEAFAEERKHKLA